MNTDQVPSGPWVYGAPWSLTGITAEILLNVLKMLYQHSLEAGGKELTSLCKHTTLIFLFNLNSAQNLNNGFKHSHTKYSFKSQMEEGEFVTPEAVTSHSLAKEIRLHLQGLLSENISKLMLASFQYPHCVPSVPLGFPGTNRTL